MDPLARRLADVVGTSNVLADADLRAPYERDWTGRWGGTARLVVRPGTHEEVVGVLRVCAQAGAAIVPQGGLTGLVGGSVPHDGEVVLSLRRLDHIDDVDSDAGTVIAGAGSTLAAVQTRARSAGWDVGVDLAARDSATIGGMVATNAGGLHVLRHGSMRAQLLGVTAVLADGSTIGRVPGLSKDSSGYHWPSLLAGSEGTLAILTAVHLQLVPLLTARCVAVVGIGSVAAAQSLCAHLRRRLSSLSAAEVFTDVGLGLLTAHAASRQPLAKAFPVYLLVEAAAREDPTDELADLLAAADLDASQVAMAGDPAGIRRLWDLRERHTEAIAVEAAARGGHVVKLDVTIPPSALPSFVNYLSDAVGSPAGDDQRLVVFGHLAEGNLHCNLLPPRGGWAAGQDEAAEAQVLQAVLDCGGSVSSEHGIGVARRAWVQRQRGRDDVQAMRSVKRALDPQGLLNPSVLLP